VRATIKDVAKNVGLSPTTVSLVLNDKPNRIATETKQAIFKAVKELNYRPNHIAVSMVTKETNTIGLILPDISNLYFSELAKVIEEQCYEHGYNVLYGNTRDSAKRDFEYLNIFLDRNVDGIIMILSSTFDEIALQRFHDTVTDVNVPIITVDRVINDKNIKSVTLDQRLGGYLATKYLINLGHRQIGCISGPKNVPSSSGRLSGYRQALEEFKIEYNEDLIYAGDFHVESGAKALPYLLGQNVSAIFASNDMMAIGAYKEAQSYRLRIPQDLSIVGFDDIFLAEYLDPPLTTISQPIEQIGKEAVKQMLLLMNHQTSQAADAIFNPILKVRGSAAKFDGSGNE